MTFREPWVAGAVAAAVMALAGVSALVRRRRGPRGWAAEAPVANVDHAAASARFRRRLRRHRSLVGGEVLLLSLTGLAALVLVMQPLGDRTRERAALSRDVMLCLDVSGSMKELDESILRQFTGIATGLPGDRIGLTIWNGAAITVFPLTDDAAYVAATLEYGVDQLNRGSRAFVAGTEEGGSSLIGDGLASCVLRFDRPGEDRARSIVFATDNALAGDPIVSLNEAAAMARDRGIRVYSVAAAGQITEQDARELEEAVALTGGAYLTTADEKVVEQVVARITELEGTHLDQPPEVVRDDRPAAWAGVALAGVALLAALAGVLRR